MTSRWSSLASGLRPVALLLLGALAWEIAARSGRFSPLIIPSLARIGYQLWLLATQPESLAEVWYSVARGLGGVARGAGLGVGHGVGVGGRGRAAPGRGPLGLAVLQCERQREPWRTA